MQIMKNWRYANSGGDVIQFQGRRELEDGSFALKFLDRAGKIILLTEQQLEENWRRWYGT